MLSVVECCFFLLNALQKYDWEMLSTNIDDDEKYERTRGREREQEEIKTCLLDAWW